ncbi:auxin response factor 19-like [Dorcoceras hygrometricum]|uniref:Auxin response factor n=1 Tax=Dorcoceras hygrometricum TaxID=472368 RepID=A0A2Z7A9B0_9LAMI|nr:auxin response factor 19-like [Dorcoceras hygrometricum]
MKSSSSAGAVPQPANATPSPADGEKKSINEELWQACAGPLVNLPAAGTHVVYFPQGHSEHVSASMRKDVDSQVPNYPNLPSKLLCLLHNVKLHADPETDEVYVQMTLQPVPSFDKDSLLRSDLSMKANKPQTEFFCKTLTASDTSTHGGDFTMQPPAQELVARDLHDNIWTFRHIFRGQPKRHLLTTGWSLFVGGKRLLAGDSVLFIRDEKQQLLLGIRRANRQPTNLSSSVLSSDSMHIGILAAAAHAAANDSPFTVFYNPRASPSEFVIPLAKYYRAVCSNQISLGMRFRMMFETEESGTRRYMGTITGITDLDPVRWKNSQWRNIQVGWDESTVGERRNRVSIWEIEPVTAPFFICPSPPFIRSKRPRQPGMPDDDVSDLDSIFRRGIPWLSDEFGLNKDHPQGLPGLSLVQWMSMQQNSSLPNSIQPNSGNPLSNSVLPNFNGCDISHQVLGAQLSNNIQFSAAQRLTPPAQLDQLQILPPSTLNPLGSIVLPQQQFTEVTQMPRPNLLGQALPTNQVQPLNVLQQQQSLLNHQLQRNLAQNLSQHQGTGNSLQHNLMSSEPPDHVSDNQVQLQLLQKLRQQQQSLLAQQSVVQQAPVPTQLLDQQKHLLDIPSNFSRPMPATKILDSPKSHVIAQQMARSNSQMNLKFAQSPQQTKLQQSRVVQELPVHQGNALNLMNNQISTDCSGCIMPGATGGGGHSVVTDDVPSCSTSPSMNNFPNTAQYAINSNDLETMPSDGNLTKDFQKKYDVKATLNVPKSPDLGFFTSQSYLNGTQLDYLDSSSSATSVISQNDAQVSQNNTVSFNPQSILLRDAIQDVEVHGDMRNSVVSFDASIENQFGMPMMQESFITKNMEGSSKDFTSNVTSEGGILSSFENSKVAQPELSSSMVSQSFGIPDMTFNSIDSTMNDGNNFVSKGAWAQPQMPRMRTFTKVYKRGAVGRSIDIARYSGYDELKQDLARRFGIEGQLEDRQRIGWKLVYVDHENDVLLVGDDPWEEFVNCVHCIKILSPQEVQQMSFDGDFENGVLRNQTCSTSDNGIN